MAKPSLEGTDVQVISFELEFFILPRLKPQDHRVLVALFELVLVVPLEIRLIDMDRFRCFVQGACEVA